MSETQKNKQSLPAFGEFAPPETETREKFPFFVRRFGHLAEKRLHLPSPENPDDVLIFYVVSGVVEFSRGKELRYITENDLVISSWQVPPRFRVVSAGKAEIYYLLISGSHVKYFYNMVRPKFNVLRINPMSAVPEILASFTECDYSGSLAGEMGLSLTVHRLFSALYEVSRAVVRAKTILPVTDSDVNAAIAYIKSHYKDGITLDDICKEIHLSKYYFCKIFKQHTGTTLHEYLNEYRVHKSKDLLSYSQLSVAAVGRMVGFPNPLTFNRAFKKVMNMTPGEYRKNF